MNKRTPEAPFPDACLTGRAFISPCCTSSTREFCVDGVLYLASRVTGHGWSVPWPGRIEDINDTGTVVEKDGSERPIRWRADREEP